MAKSVSYEEAVQMRNSVASLFERMVTAARAENDPLKGIPTRDIGQVLAYLAYLSPATSCLEFLEALNADFEGTSRRLESNDI